MTRQAGAAAMMLSGLAALFPIYGALADAVKFGMVADQLLLFAAMVMLATGGGLIVGAVWLFSTTRQRSDDAPLP